MRDVLLQWVSPLAHALCAFAWQGALIGMVAALSLRLSRRAGPRTRYAIATLSLVACPVVFVLTLMTGATMTGTIAVAPASSVVLATARGAAAMEWIVPFWLAGVAVLLLRLITDLRHVRRMRAAGAPSERWQQCTDALARALGITRIVELRVVAQLDSPVCFGWIKPVVLMPLGLLAHLPVEQLEALIAHELAHLRRHDYLVNLLQKLVETLLFFHPVVWWLTRRMQRERELIADDIAASAAATPRTLALALAGLSQWRAQGPLPSLALAAGRGELKARVQALLGRPSDAVRSRPSPSLSVAMQVVLAVAALAVMLPLHAIVVTQAPASVPEPARAGAGDAAQALREGIEAEHARTQERMEAAMDSLVGRWESLHDELAGLTEGTPPDAAPAVLADASSRHAALMRDGLLIEQEMRQLQQAYERDMRAIELRYEALLE